MDWREFMRGVFGYSNSSRSQLPSSSSEQRDNDNNSNNVWPPPPPIPEFTREQDELRALLNEPDVDREEPVFPRGGFFWGRRPMEIPPNEEINEERAEQFSGQFVFGDLFSMMGGMFQEMERSMRDMDRFFGNLEIEDGDRTGPSFFPPGNGHKPVHPQTDANRSGQSPRREENLRDFVLKDKDLAESHQSGKGNKNWNNIAEPQNPSDKIDRDLDVLYQNSMLDLSELPLPSQEESQQSSQSHIPSKSTPRPGRGGIQSFSQRTFQTFSFKNGRMEGETVKENENGRYVTKYYVDEHGKKQETTEFFPRDGSEGSRHGQEIGPLGPQRSIIVPSNEHSATNFMQFLDRIFKPRM